MRNPICKVILSTCLLSSTAITAIGQSTQENRTKCQSADLDVKIAGCTALIQADQDTIKNRALIYGSRGVGYYKKGEYDHAIQDTAQAIHLNPDEPSFYYTSGLAYKKKENFDQAIQAFDEAIRLSPKFQRAYYDRGNAYIDKDEYDRAIQDFNEAIRLNPHNANNYNNRGVAYQRWGNNDRANRELQPSPQSEPERRDYIFQPRLCLFCRVQPDSCCLGLQAHDCRCAVFKFGCLFGSISSHNYEAEGDGGCATARESGSGSGSIEMAWAIAKALSRTVDSR